MQRGGHAAGTAAGTELAAAPLLLGLPPLLRPILCLGHTWKVESPWDESSTTTSTLPTSLQGGTEGVSCDVAESGCPALLMPDKPSGTLPGTLVTRSRPRRRLLLWRMAQKVPSTVAVPCSSCPPERLDALLVRVARAARGAHQQPAVGRHRGGACSAGGAGWEGLHTGQAQGSQRRQQRRVCRRHADRQAALQAARGEGDGCVLCTLRAHRPAACEHPP